jgi:hypothetical protein
MMLRRYPVPAFDSNGNPKDEFVYLNPEHVTLIEEKNGEPGRSFIVFQSGGNVVIDMDLDSLADDLNARCAEIDREGRKEEIKGNR